MPDFGKRTHSGRWISFALEVRLLLLSSLGSECGVPRSFDFFDFGVFITPQSKHQFEFFFPGRIKKISRPVINPLSRNLLQFGWRFLVSLESGPVFHRLQSRL